MKTAENLVADYIEFKHPNEFHSVVKDLKLFLQQGLIKQISGTCSLSDISPDKPLPDDLINIEFESIPKGTKYRLSCETFHGLGGVFKKI